MRAPRISSFFFAFFPIFSISSNTELHNLPKTAPSSTGFPNLSPPSPPNGAFIDVSYPPNAPQPLPTANLSTTWTNDESSIPSINFTDGSRIRVILDEERFACGFFCNGNCTSYLFAILIKLSYSQRYIFGLKGKPTVIWSANRDYPVKKGAILNLTADGELVLKDVDGTIVWTTNTTRKSVVGMKLDDNGNLVMLSNGDKSIVWQSFDHPTDCLVIGQKLFQGQKLIPSVSSTNWTAQKDSYYLHLTDKALSAYVESNPPLIYYRHLINGTNTSKGMVYAELLNGSLGFFDSSSTKLDAIDIPQRFPLQYIKVMPDGHLKAFGGETVADLLIQDDFGECSYPLACGRNAICSGDMQCSCPKSGSFGTEYFTAVDDSQPNKGCSRVAPLRCNATQYQDFIEFKNIKYITYTSDMANVDMETCKQACLNNCTCKAAIFAYRGSNSSSGYCDLPSELFTMTSFDENKDNQLHASAFIKVQNGISPSTKKKNQTTKVIGPIVGSLVFIAILVVGFTKFIIKKKKMDDEIEEEQLDKVTGMPTRFPYEELKTATENFSKKLGEGGFGSVFRGTLKDGSQIAVKCLQGLAHVKKSFLAEVESIGSIHHVNLVRLRGFCAWKSERLLVYEFMSNGSLDQWIYSGNRKNVLGWECRKKIILDIAKGLAYLHEDCRQKIIHLDIKPQNILLDEDFNAKVADFGLSKLIDRDESQVVTTMRGTPGYLAPEWLSSFITEKVDVYSFGILLLEILCGRKIFDRSQPEESWHLLCVFQRSWEQETLLNIVDRYSEDMQIHGTEVLEMMKVASWCLQTDFTKRPSMSTVIKVLEGVISVESNLDYNFSYPRLQEATDEEDQKSSKSVLPSILSGPR